MSLVSYEDARPWAKSIRKKVASREIPPWGADPHYGKFKDDRSLSSWDEMYAPQARITVAPVG